VWRRKRRRRRRRRRRRKQQNIRDFEPIARIFEPST
jgi:hypothetical protein